MAGDINDTVNFAHICSSTSGVCTCYQPTYTTWTYPVPDPILLAKLQELEAKLDHLLELFMEL